jgi:hypothetical protein
MLDLAVSFTATRDLDTEGQEVILNVLITGIPHAARYITGGCVGGDTFISRWLFTHRPEAWHEVIVPANRSRVDFWWDRTPGLKQALLTAQGVLFQGDGGAVLVVVFMHEGTTYADRNAELVRRGTAVCGFPAYPEDDPRSRRSGTWQTARIARRAGKLCRWDCIQPPFAGRIEKPLGEFASELQDG